MKNNEEDDYMYNDYLSNVEYKNKFKCAICGDIILVGKRHDPRPIVSERGEFCCSECNKEVVIPTRRKVWTEDDE